MFSSDENEKFYRLTDHDWTISNLHDKKPWTRSFEDYFKFNGFWGYNFCDMERKNFNKKFRQKLCLKKKQQNEEVMNSSDDDDSDKKINPNELCFCFKCNKDRVDRGEELRSNNKLYEHYDSTFPLRREPLKIFHAYMKYRRFTNELFSVSKNTANHHCYDYNFYNL